MNESTYDPVVWLQDHETMGAWVRQALEVHPSIRAGAVMRPSVEWGPDHVLATWDGEPLAEYRISSQERRTWWEPLTARHARQLADELLEGLREGLRSAQKGKG